MAKLEHGSLQSKCIYVALAPNEAHQIIERLAGLLAGTKHAAAELEVFDRGVPALRVVICVDRQITRE